MHQENFTVNFDHVVCGGGLVGVLWALYLKRMSNSVAVFESYNDIRQELIPGGRSINLVLSKKALDALDQLGIKQRVLKCTIPIKGQTVHCSNGNVAKLPYGLNQNDITYQIPRNKLNQCLLDIADCSDVQIFYNCTLVEGDIEKNQYIFNTQDPNGVQVPIKVKAKYMYGADGAASKVRELILKKVNKQTNVEWSETDYKQLFLPVNIDTKNYYYDPNWVHIWPRGGHMIMGHANFQGSFSLTLILPSSGHFSFEQIGKSEQKIIKYFEEYYPDLVDKIPNLPVQFTQNPLGYIGTIQCPVWHYKDKVVLLGDAAHTITPFLWQAVNIGMDDCLRLNRMVNQYGFTEQAFNQYFKFQKPMADSLAELTAQNFQVICNLTDQSPYLNLKLLQKQVQKLYPTLFYSKYRLLYFEDKHYGQIQILNQKYQRILNEINEKRIPLQKVGQFLTEKLYNNGIVY